MKEEWYRQQIEDLGWRATDWNFRENRPEFNVAAILREDGQEYFIKQFDPRNEGGYRIYDGPRNGFLRSYVIPRAARMLAMNAATDPSGFVEILDDHFISADVRGPYPWYFMMKLYPDPIDVENDDDVHQALGCIESTQAVHPQALREFIMQMDDLSPWVKESVLFRPADYGTVIRYMGNIGDSISGIVQHDLWGRDEPELKSEILTAITFTNASVRFALELPENPELVLAHRDTGIDNFRRDHDGRIALIDWEHTRLDNPLSDYVHLWLQLMSRGRKGAAEVVIDRLRVRFDREIWYAPLLRVCICEKILGQINHILHVQRDWEAMRESVIEVVGVMVRAFVEVHE